MPTKRISLVVHKRQPHWGKLFSFVGFFKTKQAAEDWANASAQAGKDYPFWLQEKKSLKKIGQKYVLWWYKPHKGKMIGTGYD